MADTFSKREREKKKQKKKLEKEAQREARREEKPESFKDMIVYVDEFGVLHETEPTKKPHSEIDAEDIVIGVPSVEDIETTIGGYIHFYDEDKGYGFIKTPSGETVFMHSSNVSGQPAQGKKVQFEKQRSHKGWEAINVKVV